MYWIRHSVSTKVALISGASVVKNARVSRLMAPAPALIVGVIFPVVQWRFATLWTLRAAAAVMFGRFYGHSEIVTVRVLISSLFSSPTFSHDAQCELLESWKAIRGNLQKCQGC
jgi:hypothetical protein